MLSVERGDVSTVAKDSPTPPKNPYSNNHAVLRDCLQKGALYGHCFSRLLVYRKAPKCSDSSDLQLTSTGVASVVSFRIPSLSTFSI